MHNYSKMCEFITGDLEDIMEYKVGRGNSLGSRVGFPEGITMKLISGR